MKKGIMLNIEEVKEILNDEKISNEEALKIRDNLYGLAKISIEGYIEDNDIDVVKI